MWCMKPVRVSIDVAQAREDVYDFLDENAWARVPRREALAAPLVRAILRRGNQRSLERLAGELQAGKAGGARPAAD